MEELNRLDPDLESIKVDVVFGIANTQNHYEISRAYRGQDRQLPCDEQVAINLPAARFSKQQGYLSWNGKWIDETPEIQLC